MQPSSPPSPSPSHIFFLFLPPKPSLPLSLPLFIPLLSFLFLSHIFSSLQPSPPNSFSLPSLFPSPSLPLPFIFPSFISFPAHLFPLPYPPPPPTPYLPLSHLFPPLSAPPAVHSLPHPPSRSLPYLFPFQSLSLPHHFLFASLPFFERSFLLLLLSFHLLFQLTIC